MTKEDLLELGARYVSLAQGRQVTAKFDPKAKLALADLETRSEILLNEMALESVLEEEGFRDAFLGLCLHEGAYNRFTPSTWPMLVRMIAAELKVELNTATMAASWAEDAYVDSHLNEDLPGFRRYLDLGRSLRASVDERQLGTSADPMIRMQRLALDPKQMASLPEEDRHLADTVRTVLALGRNESVLDRVLGSVLAVKDYTLSYTPPSLESRRAEQEPDLTTPEPGEEEPAESESSESEGPPVGRKTEEWVGEADPESRVATYGGAAKPYELIPQASLDEIQNLPGRAAYEREILAANYTRAQKLRRMLRFRDLPSRRLHSEYGLRSGDLDEDVLALIPTGYQEAFEITEEYTVKHDDIDLAILLDESGSMSTGKRNRLSVAAIACIQYAVAPLRSVRLRVYGFTSDSETYSAQPTAVFLHYDSGRGITGPYLKSTLPKCENRDGDAVRCVRHDLAGTDRKAAILMLSDGDPWADDYGGSAAMAHVAKEVEDVLADGILFHHLQIGDARSPDLQTMYGDRWSKVGSVSEVPERVAALVKHWLD